MEIILLEGKDYKFEINPYLNFSGGRIGGVQFFEGYYNFGVPGSSCYSFDFMKGNGSLQKVLDFISPEYLL